MVLLNPNDLPTGPLGDLTQFSLLVCRGLIEGRNPEIEDCASLTAPPYAETHITEAWQNTVLFSYAGRSSKKLDFSVGKKGDFSGAFFVHPRWGLNRVNLSQSPRRLRPLLQHV
jgi:hypothetical protein